MPAITILILLLTAPVTDTAAGDSVGPVRFFFDTALLAGGETATAGYQRSWFCLHSDLGFEFRGREQGRDIGRRFGLAVTGSILRDDLRLGLGPRMTWRFRPDWAWQVMAGPVWSGEQEERALFDVGVKVRAGLIYREAVSFTALWQSFPYGSGYETPGEGRHDSLYGGVMLHGTGGTILSTVAWGTLVGLIIAYLVSYGS